MFLQNYVCIATRCISLLCVTVCDVCTYIYTIGSFVNAHFPRKLQFNDSFLVCTIVLYSEKLSRGLVFMDN